MILWIRDGEKYFQLLTTAKWLDLDMYFTIIH